jgi:hypothetical protein
MTAQPIGARPVAANWSADSPWYPGPICNRTYLVAAARAALFALVLAMIFAMLVLF